MLRFNQRVLSWNVMDDKEKVAEATRLFEELAFQEKIVLGYTDKEMIELFRGKIKEIKKVITS